MESNRQRRLQAQRSLNQPETPFIEIDIASAGQSAPKWATRAFMNNRYFVTVDDNSPTTHGLATKALIQNHFDEPIKKHWSEIQRIKNEIFGEETVAIEYFPKQSELIDKHNIYWIWIFPAEILPLPNKI